MARLGRLEVSAQGLGCTGMSDFHGHAQEASLIASIHRAIEAGVTFLDTSDVSAHGADERLVGRAIAGRRDDVVLATKFGLRTGDDPEPLVDGRPEYVREAIEHSLHRLGADHVELYYLQRPDPIVPLEETVGAMGELVTAGLVAHLGLCDVTAEQLRRADAVHAIAAVQTRAPADVLAACRELATGLVVPLSGDGPPAPAGDDVVSLIAVADPATR